MVAHPRPGLWPSEKGRYPVGGGALVVAIKRDVLL